MAGDLIYAFRIMRLPLLDAGGATIGRIDDIVLAPGARGTAPRVLGFVASSQRRRIFVNANRVASLDSEGARLRSWDLDMNPFKPKAGEILVGAHVIDRRVGDETVSDVALRQVTDGRQNWWEPSKVRLARRTMMRRRPSYRLVDITETPTLFSMQAGGEMAAEAARLRDMHPSDVAGVVRSLPLAQRKQLAAAMDDERLADLLEELPEAEQLRIIEGLDIERMGLVPVLYREWYAARYGRRPKCGRRLPWPCDRQKNTRRVPCLGKSRFARRIGMWKASWNKDCGLCDGHN